MPAISRPIPAQSTNPFRVPPPPPGAQRRQRGWFLFCFAVAAHLAHPVGHLAPLHPHGRPCPAPTRGNASFFAVARTAPPFPHRTSLQVQTPITKPHAISPTCLVGQLVLFFFLCSFQKEKRKKKRTKKRKKKESESGARTTSSGQPWCPRRITSSGNEAGAAKAVGW